MLSMDGSPNHRKRLAKHLFGCAALDEIGLQKGPDFDGGAENSYKSAGSGSVSQSMFAG